MQAPQLTGRSRWFSRKDSILYLCRLCPQERTTRRCVYILRPRRSQAALVSVLNSGSTVTSSDLDPKSATPGLGTDVTERGLEFLNTFTFLRGRFTDGLNKPSPRPITSFTREDVLLRFSQSLSIARSSFACQLSHSLSLNMLFHMDSLSVSWRYLLSISSPSCAQIRSAALSHAISESI